MMANSISSPTGVPRRQLVLDDTPLHQPSNSSSDDTVPLGSTAALPSSVDSVLPLSIFENRIRVAAFTLWRCRLP